MIRTLALILSSVSCAVVAIWDELPKLPSEFVKPVTWKQKHFGQWCRNFTVNVHNQCPQGSFIHWYTCCGPDNTDCCFGIQTWFYVVSGFVMLAVLSTFVFFLLIQLNVIYPRKEKKTAENGLEYDSVGQI